MAGNKEKSVGTRSYLDGDFTLIANDDFVKI